ncbi:gibberellin 20 oxidase [Musa troglodytarum]|uniref:Gibberellin 20 oxidase n=1 Tax=Musa troglodytarum TaxID=320322 RepID=A0A9E7HN86_9LILI|nr:gibberellin 20 oxidase [Musa troglodytarum]
MCRRRDCKLKLRVGISPNKAARSQQLPGRVGARESTTKSHALDFSMSSSAVGLPAKRLQPSDLFGLTNGRHWPFFLPTSPLLLLLLPTLRCLPIYAFQTKCRPFITSFVFFSPCLPYKYPTPPPPPPAFISFMSPLLRLSLPHALPSTRGLFPGVSSPMDCNPTAVVLRPSLALDKEREAGSGGVGFNSPLLPNQATIPEAFVWRQCDRPTAIEELDSPVVDLDGFLRGDEASTARAVDCVRAACSTHGFFQVANHGVDASLARDALGCMAEFFELPLCHKLRARRKPGSMWGYTGAHADRFSSELPWKETLSFGYHEAGDDRVVVDYFTSTLGNDFQRMG